MRLTKVQKKLKEIGVQYNYSEREVGFGSLEFWDASGTRYSVNEHGGNTGNSVQGIRFRPVNASSSLSQASVCRWIDENKELFAVEEGDL